VQSQVCPLKKRTREYLEGDEVRQRARRVVELDREIEVTERRIRELLE